jgi:hypothetical protein
MSILKMRYTLVAAAGADGTIMAAAGTGPRWQQQVETLCIT